MQYCLLVLLIKNKDILRWYSIKKDFDIKKIIKKGKLLKNNASYYKL